MGKSATLIGYDMPALSFEFKMSAFYTIFGPRGMDAAQLAFWDAALSSALKSDAVKKDLDFNFWTVDIIGHRDLPAFLEKELDAYRRTLLALGMAK